MASRSIIIAVLLVAVGCAPPPTADCVNGEYLLSGTNDVRLIVSGTRFKLIVRENVVEGSFSFNRRESAYQFRPESGGISPADQRAVAETLRGVGGDASFLNDFTVGAAGASYEVYESDRVIVQMDYESTFFWKAGCRH